MIFIKAIDSPESCNEKAFSLNDSDEEKVMDAVFWGSFVAVGISLGVFGAFGWFILSKMNQDSDRKEK
ncbi:hypothetical protein DC094_07930 [Pelagibaculum spongiae]|uniref:Uncharacterized protein n=1 Tax=Pelagibaculum spongiae TaxID=2080658 RepID=A0A2V1H233_9GAMM|nr:hypothetical protein DC094_07930 [Pelagibaculum spongiae]